jgi:hypothetical protein
MMFDVYFRPSVPGFRVEPYDEVPGFNIDENAARAHGWSSRRTATGQR